MSWAKKFISINISCKKEQLLKSKIMFEKYATKPLNKRRTPVSTLVARQNKLDNPIVMILSVHQDNL